MVDNNDDDNDDKMEQIVLDLLAKSLKTVIAGAIDIDMEGKAALRFEVDKVQERINIDFIHADVLQLAESETEDRIGLFDKLKTAREFSHKLTDNGLTLSFLRKGKEAITLGKDAHPTLSKLITRSDDIQIDSVRESIKLGRDLKNKEE
ncbi:MAG TPA: hypothetical protein VH796_12915 [Nitrososphaeraceae archaeon]|jgi:hypothetical protein